jgi:hypothetical protein
MDKCEEQLDFPTVQRKLEIKAFMTNGDSRDSTIQVGKDAFKYSTTHPVPTIITASLPAEGTINNDNSSQKSAA